jgi:hypothetical protein
MASDHGCFCTFFFFGYTDGMPLAVGNAFLLLSFIENLREIPLRLSCMSMTEYGIEKYNAVRQIECLQRRIKIITSKHCYLFPGLAPLTLQSK